MADTNMRSMHLVLDVNEFHLGLEKGFDVNLILIIMIMIIIIINTIFIS